MEMPRAGVKSVAIEGTHQGGELVGRDGRPVKSSFPRSVTNVVGIPCRHLLSTVPFEPLSVFLKVE